MAQKDLGGLKISLVADATQLKSTFETAVAGLKGQKIPVVISATRDPSIQQTLDYIRSQKIAVNLSIAARRNSIRQLRMDIQSGIAQQGGVKVPVTIKPPTKAEAQTIREQISTAIGVIEVPWTWGKGPGGPPGYDGPGFPFFPPGGGGGAGAAGPFRAGTGRSDEDVIRVLRQILGVQTATHKATQDETAQATQETPKGAAAAQAVFTGRTPRKRRAYKQQAGESDEEWMARTLERRAELIERMSSPSADVRRKTQQRIERIDALLGPSRVPSAVPLGPDYPERIDPITGEVYRGSKGRLASETRPGPGSVSRQRQEVHRRLGIDLSQDIPVLGDYLKGYSSEEQNILLDRINAFLGSRGAREQQTGFKGQRTSRSFFEPGPGPRGEREPAERAAIVEAGDFIDAFIAEIEAGDRDDFRNDAKAMEAFKRKYGIGRTPSGRKRKRKGGEFGPDFERLNALLEDQGEVTYTGKKRVKAHYEYPQGRIGEALYGTGVRGEEDFQPGAVQLRARLLTAAASGQLPGVGKAAVRLAVAPNRGDIKAGRLTTEGLEFIEQFDALTTIINEARNRARNMLQDAQRADSGQKSAATQDINQQYPGGALAGRSGTRRGRQFSRPPTLAEQATADAMAASYATGSDQRLADAERLRAKYGTGEDEAAATGRINPSASGFKLHLGVAEANRDAVREALTRLERDNNFRFKSGRNSGQTGKDFTLYTGSRENTQLIANLVQAELGHLLKSPRGTDAGRDDELFAPKVPGRFDVAGPGFHQYGRHGVPFTTEAQADIIFGKKGRTAKEREQRLQEAEDESRRLLTEQFGSFFTGEPGEPTLGGISDEHMQVLRDFLGGGGGGGGFPGGGFGGGYQGGVVPVQVQNWPQGLEEGGAMAAGQFKGSDDFFQKMSDSVATGVQSLQEFMVKGGGGGGAREPKTAKEKKAVEDERFARAVSFAQVLTQAQVAGTPIEGDEADDLERLVQSRMQSLLGAQRGRTREAQEFAQQAVELSPARAVATAAGQIFANLPGIGGRSSLLERKRVADEAEAAEKKAYRQVEDRQRAIAGLESQQSKLTDTESKRYKALSGQIATNVKALDRETTAWRTSAEEAEKKARSVAGAADIMRSFGAGVVGTIAGQILFQGVLGLAQVGVQAFTAAVEPAIERTLGYQNATSQLTASLKDQIRASGGAKQAAVAGAAAQANLSSETYESIRGFLEQRSAVQAGNAAFEEQIRMIQASRNLREQQGGAGLPPGVDPGLFRTTGGLNILGIQTPIAGQKPYEELLREQIGSIGSRMEALMPPIQDEIARALSFGLIQPETSPQERLQNREAALGDILDDLGVRFRDTGIEFVRANSESAASLDDTVKKLQAAGIQVTGAELQRADIRLSREAAALPTDEFRIAVARANERDQRPKREVLLQALEERALPALMYGIQQNLQNQLETFIPAQRGLRFAAQPLAPFGQTFQPLTPNVAGPAGLGASAARFLGGYTPGTSVSGIGGAPTEVPPEVIASFNMYEAEATAAIEAINAKAREGEQVLTQSLGVPESTISELKGLGARIADITQQQNAIRLDLQYSQYNRQLFIARRTLGDLAGLTERSGATQIGLLEREMLILGRKSTQIQLQGQLLGLQTGELQQQSSEIGHQSQLLQLELAQRQINFQRAIAGFVTPGLTPEERAARVEEAKLEADYAQKQLDFQKQQAAIAAEQIAINREQIALQRQSYELAVQQFQTQVALQDAQNQRAYEDQLAIIEEIQKAFSAQTQIQALEEMKQLLTTQRDLLLEEIQAQVGAMEEMAKAQAQFSQEILSQTGEFVEEIVTDVAFVFNKIAAAFRNSELGRLLGYGPTGSNGNYPNGDPIEPHWQRAAGFSGRVTGATHMIVGEAGPEEVAILKNPRQVMMGGMGGGGGTVIQITVSGNNVYDEASEARLAARIAGEVEQVIGRRASQQGFRFASR